MDLSIVTLLEGGRVDQDETQLKQMLPPDFLNITQRMLSWLTESFDKIWPDPRKGHVGKPTMEEVTGKLKEHFGATDSAERHCSACCLLCGMMCLKHQYHDGKYETIHQPAGLKDDPRKGGGRWRRML